MKKLLRTAGCVFAVLCVAASGGAVLASSSNYEYTYNSRGNATAAPGACEYERTVGGDIRGAYSPEDLFVHQAANGVSRIFVADSAGNRIIILNEALAYDGEISSFGNGDGFSSPRGVFVTREGEIYVADTENKRVVHLDAKGTLLRVLPTPKSEVLPESFDTDYKPSKVAVDTAGRIFVVSMNFNMGLIELDRNGGFVQMTGAARVSVSPIDWFWYTVSTDAQRDRIRRFVPTEYNNVCIDDEDFVYVTTSTYDRWTYSSITPVRKLNASGDDILRRQRAYGSLGDVEVSFAGSVQGPSSITDICAQPYGVYSILDARRGRVFTYDANGNLLYLFGGLGDTQGAFSAPSSLAALGDRYLISDTNKRSITVYKRTEYGTVIHEVMALHGEGRYDEEADLWREVLRRNVNSELAHVGLGKAYFRTADYESAMRHFRIANDRENYSRAFEMNRRRMLTDRFALVMTGILVFAAICVTAGIIKKRLPRREHKKVGFTAGLRYAGYIAVRPFDGFWDMKREKRGHMGAAVLFLALLTAAMVIQRQYAGFLFNYAEPDDFNLLLQAAAVLAPVALWCVSNWCVTSLLNGEGSLRYILMSAGYAVVPMIVSTLIYTILSNGTTLAEGDFLYVILIIGYLWSGLLLIFGNRQIHNYSMGYALIVILLTLLVMVIIVFVGMLCVILIQQILDFIKTSASELSLR